MTERVRINKYLADQGLVSRREADALIKAGRVRHNGAVASLGAMVEPEDTVEIIGKRSNKRYIAYYKGRGIITHSPGPDETDIATKIRADYGITGIFPVGRLDKDSEGLIILTDDGRVTRELLKSENEHPRTYEVTVDKPINNWFLRHMAQGVKIERYTTKPATITPAPRNPKRFTLALTEGKKHQIRRMCAALGYQVQSLKRVQIANIKLGRLKPNQYRKITGEELQLFLDALKLR